MAGAAPRPASEGGGYVYIRPCGEVTQDLMRSRERSGPLAGWTFAVKDLIAVAGLSLGAGSRAREGIAPELEDAPIVDQLRRRGAVMVGTTTLHELAFGVTGINDYAGTPVNPLVPGAVPGGSSSGSAVAVAEGSARIALGTDTGGSVRIPAALCGVVGFKPAYGSYSKVGVLPLAPSLDHVGVLARSVADVRVVHAALGHPDEAPSAPTRLGLVKSSLEDAEPSVAEAIEQLITRASQRGCVVVELAWPDAERVAQISTTIMFAEAAHVHRGILARCPELLGADVRHRLETGASLSSAVVAEAEAERRLMRSSVLALFDAIDCIVSPTVGLPAPRVEDARESTIAGRLVANTRLANITGVPAISLPVAATPTVGLQVIAATDDETLAAAAWIAQLGQT